MTHAARIANAVAAVTEACPPPTPQAKEGSTVARGAMNDVWIRYKQSPTQEDRNRLLEHYLPLVQRCAQRLAAKLPATVQLDDLISAGVFGLMNAVESFEPDRQVRFSTFSAIRIRGAILDELRSMDWVPRLVRSNVKKLEAASRQLEGELGRSPTDEEMADRMKLTPGNYRHVADDTRAVAVASLSAPRPGATGGEDNGEYHPLPDPRSADPLDETQRRALKETVTRGLSRAERLLVTLYYYEDLTMREVGQVLDLSESRVSQMHTQIVKRLQAAAAREGSVMFRELAA